MSMRILVNGFPGSGNILFQKIIGRLIEMKGACTVVDDKSKTAYENWYELTRIVRNYMPLLNINSSTYRGMFGFMHGLQEGQGIPLSEYAVTGLPIGELHWIMTYMGSHELLNADVLRDYGRLGYKVVYIERNPADIVLSFAAKEGKGDPESMLKNAKWFGSVAERVVHYHKLSKTLGLFSVSYDDLITKPISTIKTLAEFLDVDVDTRICEKTWNEFAFKNLAHEGHLWKGGVGKSKDYFNTQHREILLKSGVDSGDLEHINKKGVLHNENFEYSTNTAFLDALHYHTIGKLPVIKSPEVCSLDFSGVTVIALKKWKPRIEKMFQSNIFWAAHNKSAEFLDLNNAKYR